MSADFMKPLAQLLCGFLMTKNGLLQNNFRMTVILEVYLIELYGKFKFLFFYKYSPA